MKEHETAAGNEGESANSDNLVRLDLLIEGVTSRWIRDLCRSVDTRPRGAVRVGRYWLIRRRDFDRWIASRAEPEHAGAREHFEALGIKVPE